MKANQFRLQGRRKKGVFGLTEIKMKFEIVILAA